MCVNLIRVPVTSRRTGKTRYIEAPCGKCIECLKKRQNDWKLRICHECKYWSHVYFFTLTYKPETCIGGVFYRDTLTEPLFICSERDWNKYYSKQYDDDVVFKSTAVKSDVQLWFKALREDISRKCYDGGRFPCKYFICAEYGPNPNGTKRPHYHGILMCDLPFNDLKPYFNKWHDNIGRVDFREVGITREDKSSVANYISKYCAKGCFESRREDIENGFIECAWSVMSKNIGERWIKENKLRYLSYVPQTSSIEGLFDVDDIDQIYHSTNGLDLPFWSELDSLIENNYIYDGDIHKYSMPRYYRERLYCAYVSYDDVKLTNKLNLKIDYGTNKQHPTAGHFCYRWSAPPLTYETCIVSNKRYVSESFLSAALAYRLRMLADSRFNEDIRRIQDDTKCTYMEAASSVLRSNELANEYRRKSAETSLSSFYTTNMWNHREFDF